MDERVQNMIIVLGLNDAVLELYRKLAELEKNNQQDDEEYNTLCDLIKYSKQRIKKRLLQYPLNDEYMEKFTDTIEFFDNTDLFFFDYVTYLNEYRNRRLLELLIYHTKTKESELQGKLEIDGVEYDFDELDGDEYDSSDTKAFKDLLEANVKYDKAVDDYSYAMCQLEANIFMKYLLETIKQEEDIEVKERLIDVKYNILSTISCLEDSFLSDHSIGNSIDHYHRKLKFLFERNPDFYPEFIGFHSDIVLTEQDKLMERNKKKYNDVEEKVFDILTELTIKTHLSCIPDEDVRSNILVDNSAAIELTKSRLDKKLLKKSFQLNKQFVINN